MRIGHIMCLYCSHIAKYWSDIKRILDNYKPNVIQMLEMFSKCWENIVQIWDTYCANETNIVQILGNYWATCHVSVLKGLYGLD